MWLRFEITGPEGPPRAEERILRESLVLGRSPSSDVVLDDRRVSGRHLLLTRAGAEVLAEDQASVNGTRLKRGSRATGLAPGAPLALADGDVLTLGRLTVRVWIGSRAPAEVSPPTDEIPLVDVELLAGSLIDELPTPVPAPPVLDEAALEDQRRALRGHLAAQEVEQRLAEDTELKALHAQLEEWQGRERAALATAAESRRRAEGLVAEVVDGRQAVVRLEAELRATESAAETAEERGRRLAQRLRQVEDERREAEARCDELGVELPPLRARWQQLMDRQAEDAARIASRRRPPGVS
ncbi:MAG: FHA domain-containing protein [Myxococcales bacterium]|nr:FHA domain-containing protein [Myxococcales bacterium]